MLTCCKLHINRFVCFLIKERRHLKDKSVAIEVSCELVCENMESSSKRIKMECDKEEISFSTSLFDLPLELLLHLGKYLRLRDIFKFRCYSRYSREVGNAMLQGVRTIVIVNGICPRNEKLLCVIMQQCHRLRKIYLCGLNEGLITDEILEKLLSNNHLLEDLEIVARNSRNITSKALTPLAMKCKNLVKLKIDKPLLGDGLAKMFNAHNNHLLDVKFCYTWENKYDMIDVWEFLKCQPKLQRIRLPGIFRFAGYGPYCERILLTIADVCKELTYLNFSWNIPSAEYHNALLKIADNCPKLTAIDCTLCKTLPDEVVNYLRSKNIEVIGNGCEYRIEYNIDPEPFP